MFEARRNFPLWHVPWYSCVWQKWLFRSFGGTAEAFGVLHQNFRQRTPKRMYEFMYLFLPMSEEPSPKEFDSCSTVHLPFQHLEPIDMLPHDR